MARHPPSVDAAPTFRIGEVAKLAGLTTRTLRYWEEQGLIHPSAYRGYGERRYTQTDLARITRIRELQELLGFSLAEVRVVLDTEDVDVLDRIRSEYRWGAADGVRRQALVEEAIDANDKLLGRLDSTIARIRAFREERVEKGARLRALRDELTAGPRAGTAEAPLGGPESVSAGKRSAGGRAARGRVSSRGGGQPRRKGDGTAAVRKRGRIGRAKMHAEEGGSRR